MFFDSPKFTVDTDPAPLPLRKPRRPFSPKVKTGCLRCKTRKVKCPEEKPQCSRCVRMGLSDCQYPLLSQPRELPPQPVRQAHRVLPPLAAYALARAPSTAYFGPAIARLSPPQVAYLDRFRHKVMLRITSLTFNDFWGRVILHETLNDDCVLEAVLSLGALDLAWDQANTTGKPTSPHAENGSQLSLQSSSSACYREAIRHYSRSVTRLHSRLRALAESSSSQSSSHGEHASDNVQELVPILTMLYALFEWLHGDEVAQDRLLRNGLLMVKAQEALGSKTDEASEHQDLAQPLVYPWEPTGLGGGDFFNRAEDAGSLMIRWIVLSWLLWPGASTSAAAVVRYYNRKIANGEAQLDIASPPPPPTSLAESSYETVCGMALKVVTFVTLWFARLRVDGADEATMAAVAGEEGPVLDRLRVEQRALETWVRDWAAVLSAKLATERDPIGKVLLTEFLFGCKTLTFMIQVGLPFPVADPLSSPGSKQQPERQGQDLETRSTRTAHAVMDEVEKRVRARRALGEVGLGECSPGALALVCRECRDIGVRARALTICRWGAQANALWDEKGSMIGTCALAALEERSRDPTTGLVPRSSQWQWIHAEWTSDHECLAVTFRSVTRDEAGEFRYKRMQLLAANFGYVTRLEM
ncbi:uncharacterized protein B0I36DRAFT_383499 [Microdochium trichocladiopsis]|uniref:Zn(2)-C6 fungal-type domain-containing protein n=1 Tax=Microdochium trichocladiopsis TaxID=1682393 RepID=A0A9P8YCB4_9PEZI|nr:uncharacterized protein B0I36DRAFT_383499 [Microdochium trichocladiopsis]KAH7033689.1 hypothetical protein B0I36DRAFT_383499 [Microdochium trichocladiopsis]